MEKYVEEMTQKLQETRAGHKMAAYDELNTSICSRFDLSNAEDRKMLLPLKIDVENAFIAFLKETKNWKKEKGEEEEKEKGSAVVFEDLSASPSLQDVIANKPIKQKLQMVAFIQISKCHSDAKDVMKFMNLRGGKQGASYLFYGPRGTGKRYLVSSFAKTCNLKLQVINATEIKTMIDNKHHQENGVVVYVDKVDNAEKADLGRMLDQLKKEDVIVVCSTNLPEKLDPEILSKLMPVYVDLPDEKTILELLVFFIATYTQQIQSDPKQADKFDFSKTVSLNQVKEISKQLNMFSHDEIRQFCEHVLSNSMTPTADLVEDKIGDTVDLHILSELYKNIFSSKRKLPFMTYNACKDSLRSMKPLCTAEIKKKFEEFLHHGRTIEKASPVATATT